MEKIILNGQNEVVGRIASFAAKNALQGKEIVIINSEKTIINGSDKNIITEQKEMRQINTMKPRKGPFFSVHPEIMLKRTIRGMLPNRRNGRGKEALRRIKCFEGIPEEFKNENIVKLNTKVSLNKISLEELAKRL